MKAKKTVRSICNVLSTLFLVFAIGLCLLVFVTNFVCSKTGAEPFYLGYRPCLIQTGSMEPYLMTNGIIMTKKVDSLEDIAVGDVVTYKASNGAGKTIYITHRIVEISEEGLITTKGDNNHVTDSYQLTMDNIIAKEVGVFNQPSVWLINTWNSGSSGKLLIAGGLLSFILLCYAVSTLFSSWLNSEEIDAYQVAAYSKACRKLGLIPAETFATDMARLSTQLAQEDPATYSNPFEAENTSSATDA